MVQSLFVCKLIVPSVLDIKVGATVVLTLHELTCDTHKVAAFKAINSNSACLPVTCTL